METRDTLVLRADSSPSIGTGHVMRCFAMAQAWHDRGGRTLLVSSAPLGVLGDRLVSEKILLLTIPRGADDATFTAQTARENGARWIVADGYHFGESYFSQLHRSGVRALAVEDYPRGCARVADAVLNANSYASADEYGETPRGKRFLLGCRYSLLRREFERWRSWKREVTAPAKHLLVTLGGADPTNATAKVVQAVRELRSPGLETIVVIGAANPNATAIREAAKADRSIRVESAVDDMGALMAWADLAVSASGTTVWEMAFMELPALLLVAAENQEQNAADLTERGIAQSLGRAETVTVETLRKRLHELLDSTSARRVMADRGRSLVDGEGADRVAAFLSGEDPA